MLVKPTWKCQAKYSTRHQRQLERLQHFSYLFIYPGANQHYFPIKAIHRIQKRVGSGFRFPEHQSTANYVNLLGLLQFESVQEWLLEKLVVNWVFHLCSLHPQSCFYHFTPLDVAHRPIASN